MDCIHVTMASKSGKTDDKDGGLMTVKMALIGVI